MQTAIAILGILGTVALGVAGFLVSYGLRESAFHALYTSFAIYAGALLLTIINAFRKPAPLIQSRNEPAEEVIDPLVHAKPKQSNQPVEPEEYEPTDREKEIWLNAESSG